MSSSTENEAPDQLGERIENRMKQTKAYFSDQKDRWDDLEDQLSGELQRVTTRLDEWEEFHEGMQQRHIKFRKEKQGLEEQRVALDARSTELDEQQLEIETKRRQVERELEKRRSEIEAGARNEEHEAELERLRSELEQLQQQAAQALDQRGGLDKKFQEQTKQQEQMQTQYQAAREALLSSREAGKDLQGKLGHAQKMLEKRAEQIKEMEIEFQAKEEDLRRQIEEATAQVADSNAGNGNMDNDAFNRLRTERDELINQLSQLKREMIVSGNAGALSGDGEGSDNDAVRQKLEQVVAALEDAQERNSELQAEMQMLSMAGGSDAPVAGASWEEQKAAILGHSGEFAPLDRLTVDKALRVTEEAVTKKDQEIAELQQQLAMLQSGGAAADPATDVATDVAEQARQQAELEQMKQAEIDLSLKRAAEARAAREREEQEMELQRQGTGNSGRSLRDQMGL